MFSGRFLWFVNILWPHDVNKNTNCILDVLLFVYQCFWTGILVFSFSLGSTSLKPCQRRGSWRPNGRGTRRRWPSKCRGWGNDGPSRHVIPVFRIFRPAHISSFGIKLLPLTLKVPELSLLMHLCTFSSFTAGGSRDGRAATRHRHWYSPPTGSDPPQSHHPGPQSRQLPGHRGSQDAASGAKASLTWSPLTLPHLNPL